MVLFSAVHGMTCLSDKFISCSGYNNYTTGIYTSLTACKSACLSWSLCRTLDYYWLGSKCELCKKTRDQLTLSISGENGIFCERRKYGLYKILYLVFEPSYYVWSFIWDIFAFALRISSAATFKVEPLLLR